MKLPRLLLTLLAVLWLAAPTARAQVLRGTFAAGQGHSLSIHADGSLWATGQNNYGQLGTGTTTSTTTWVQVGTDKNWVQVAACYYQSLALKTDGSLWAWGYNRYGQLGNPTNSGTTTPNPVPTRESTNGTFTQVAAGQFFSLGLKADGSLFAWGRNESGQLGNRTNSGTTTPNPVPTRESSSGTWVQVAAGANHTLALKADGSLWAWGYNSSGQLGNPTNSGSVTANNPTPTRESTNGTFVQVAAGQSHSLALKADGSLWTWGYNYYGQLGNSTNKGSSTANPTPTREASNGIWVQVAGGQYHSLGLKADGSLYAWGYNYYGELGNPTNSGIENANPMPTRESSSGTFVQVASEANHTLALKADGTLFAWGSNQYGQLGNATNSGSATANNPTPTATGTALPTRSTAAGSNFGLAVRGDGTLWAWGDNYFGQLGTGTTTAALKPVQVGTDNDWVQVAAGGSHSLGLKANGTAYAWGSNGYAQLGDGTNTSRPVPTAVSGGGVYTQLAAGGLHSLGLRANGTAYAWGQNSNGQLGDGSIYQRLTPTAVSGGGVYTQLAAGYYHSLGLQANGTAAAWGQNTYGQLGDYTAAQRLAPVTVLSGTSLYTQLAAGQYHSLALKADGTAAAWGQNTYGQLGDGTTTDRSVPTDGSGSGRYTQLAAGQYHSLGLQANGIATAWGQNTYGQLGDGTTTQRLVPTPEATAATTWALVASGPAAYSSLARTATGLKFASTGYNFYGQLGDGTTTNASRFDRVSPLTSFQPLPVQLTAFEAARTGPATVRLTWTTASETDNAGFGIEVSADGVAFARLAFVAGAGTSLTAHAYTFADNQAPAGAAYYRLAQTDASGAVTYSPVRAVAGADGTGLALFPNPASGPVQVLGVGADVPVRVYDAQGRLVRQSPAGSLRAEGLAPGLYLVRAGTATARLAVQ